MLRHDNGGRLRWIRHSAFVRAGPRFVECGSSSNRAIAVIMAGCGPCPPRFDPGFA